MYYVFQISLIGKNTEVNGAYDIVTKIASDTLDSLKDTITRHIRTIDMIRSTMTLIVVE
ncbi:hypothetical protein BH18THE2_BH18THE2_41740 [soil metagenome]